MTGTEEFTQELTDAGCDPETAAMICSLYEAGRYTEMLFQMRKRRCTLMDEMHASQKRVDRMDFLIHRQQARMG